MKTLNEPDKAEEAANADFDRRMDLVMESVDRHHTYLLGYLTRLAGPPQAEDLLQELWKYVVVHFPEDKINTLSLLRRKAYQVFVDHYRRRRAHARLVARIAEEQQEPAHIYPEDDQMDFKARFFSEYPVDLTEEQKTVLWHYGRYGLTYQEIERELGVPASTAHDWVKLGRVELQKMLNEE